MWDPGAPRLCKQILNHSSNLLPQATRTPDIVYKTLGIAWPSLYFSDKCRAPPGSCSTYIYKFSPREYATQYSRIFWPTISTTVTRNVNRKQYHQDFTSLPTLPPATPPLFLNQFPWSRLKAHGARTCRALEKGWLTRSYFLFPFNACYSRPVKLGQCEWCFMISTLLVYSGIYQISGMNEPGRDLGVWICEFSFLSRMNLGALSAPQLVSSLGSLHNPREHFLVTISLTL